MPKSSRNTFTDIPRNDVYQWPGYPLAQSGWHIKLTITGSTPEPVLYPCLFLSLSSSTLHNTLSINISCLTVTLFIHSINTYLAPTLRVLLEIWLKNGSTVFALEFNIIKIVTPKLLRPVVCGQASKYWWLHPHLWLVLVRRQFSSYISFIYHRNLILWYRRDTKQHCRHTIWDQLVFLGI